MIRSLGKRLMIHIDHELASVVRIADELLPLGIDDEVKQLQGDVADQHGTVVRDFGDSHFAITIVDCQFHRSNMPKEKDLATVLAWIVLSHLSPSWLISRMGIET